MGNFIPVCCDHLELCPESLIKWHLLVCVCVFSALNGEADLRNSSPSMGNNDSNLDQPPALIPVSQPQPSPESHDPTAVMESMMSSAPTPAGGSSEYEDDMAAAMMDEVPASHEPVLITPQDQGGSADELQEDAVLEGAGAAMKADRDMTHSEEAVLEPEGVPLMA